MATDNPHAMHGHSTQQARQIAHHEDFINYIGTY